MHLSRLDAAPAFSHMKDTTQAIMSPIQSSNAENGELNKFNSVLRLLFPCTVHIQKINSLEGHVHCLRLLTLSNGVQLMLKCSPSPTTALLRRERFLLETEARALALLAQNANPCVPQLYHYDPHGTLLGPSFLVRQHVMGSTLQEMEDHLTVDDRKDIDRHLGFLVNVIGQHAAPTFGPLEEVASGCGKKSWREAFIELFESVLRDAEDMFIHLPYAEIRREVSRLAPALEGVTLSRLVVVDLGQPSQVILDPGSKQVSGVVDFSTAVWGDVLMAEIFEDPSPAVLDGFGSRLSKDKSEITRLLLYSCYRSVHKITVQYYRHRDEAKEIDARRKLTDIIASMVRVAPNVSGAVLPNRSNPHQQV